MQEKVANCYFVPLPRLSYIYWFIHFKLSKYYPKGLLNVYQYFKVKIKYSLIKYFVTIAIIAFISVNLLYFQAKTVEIFSELILGNWH